MRPSQSPQFGDFQSNAAMGLAKDALPMGWWIGVKIDDAAVFKRVKDGELAMFSIQGTAEREELDEAA